MSAEPLELEPAYVAELLALPTLEPPETIADAAPSDPLPSAFDIAAARRDLERAGGTQWENEPEDRRATLAFDAAAARLRLRDQMERPTLAEMLDAFADDVPGSARVHPATGVRPMTDVNAAPPPEPLVGEYLALHHGEAAIIYGPGGSTKGTTAAWLALRHVRQDLGAIVYVLDFEHHEAEWGGRLRRLGATDVELGRIHYASPYGAEWTAPRGLLVDVAEYVRADCERLGVSLLIVDSITTAAASGEAMGGQAAASEYFDALSRIGRRSLSLAHVKGDAQRWPDRPFGSVHIHNLARETWAIAVVREDVDAADTHGLTLAEVELRCKKANGRRKPRAQVITYTYEPDYGAITVVEYERRVSNGDLVYDALRRTPGEWLTGKQTATAIRQDTGETITEAQVYDAIRRDRRGRFESEESVRPFRFRAKATA